MLYTGDYSRLADRHLSPADLPEVQPDVGEAANQPVRMCTVHLHIALDCLACCGLPEVQLHVMTPQAAPAAGTGCRMQSLSAALHKVSSSQAAHHQRAAPACSHCGIDVRRLQPLAPRGARSPLHNPGQARAAARRAPPAACRGAWTGTGQPALLNIRRLAACAARHLLVLVNLLGHALVDMRRTSGTSGCLCCWAFTVMLCCQDTMCSSNRF